MKKKNVVMMIVLVFLAVIATVFVVTRFMAPKESDSKVVGESDFVEYIETTEESEEMTTEESTTVYESESIEVYDPTAPLEEGEMEYLLKYENGECYITERDLQSYENFISDERLHYQLGDFYFDMVPVYNPESFQSGSGWCSVEFTSEGSTAPPITAMFDVVDGKAYFIYADEKVESDVKELPKDMNTMILPAEEETDFMEGYTIFNNSALNNEPIKFVWDTNENTDYFNGSDLDRKYKDFVSNELYYASAENGGQRVICNYLIQYWNYTGKPVKFNGSNRYENAASYFITVDGKDIELYFERDGDENALFLRYY